MAAAYQSLPQSRGKPFFFELNTDNAVYEGYHPEPPRGMARCCCCCGASGSPTGPVVSSGGVGGPGGGGGRHPRGCCACLMPQNCDSLTFKDWETEGLYQQYAYAFRRALLCRLLLLQCLALVAIGALDLAFSHRRLAFKTLALTGLLTVHLLLFVHLNCRLMRRAHLPVVSAIALLLVLLFVGIALPVEWSFVPRAELRSTSMRIEADRRYAMPDGLWQVAFAVICVYAFAPVGLFVALPFCGSMSALHVVVAALVATPPELTDYYWRMLGSNLLVLFAINLVGLLIHRGQERILRQIFTDTRDCITNRIAYQEESDKLEQLCGVVAPEPLISDLRRDFLNMTESCTGARGGTSGSGGANSSGRFPLVINHLRNVSFMSCDMLPVTQFPTDFAASEAVRLLNEVYGRFDQLAQEYSCFRVYMHSEQYLCICGYPDTRMDHAKNSVELAFAILEQINNLSDSTELGIDIRLAVHTGDAYANLLGKTRLAFDLTGEDASIAKQLHTLCTPGRVLVSKATFDQLPDGYRAESGPLFDLSPSPDGRAGRVETYYIKPRHYRSSSNLRGAGGGGGPRRARYTRLQSLEPTQKRSGLVRITQCAKFNASAPYMFLAEDLQKQCVKLRDSEEFVRKPFKRKSVTAWTVSLQRYMALTVNGPSGDGNTDESPVRSVRSLSMNLLTLRFQDRVEERAYHASEDWTFGRCMVTALCLLLASAALQAVILPWTVLLLLLFMIAFTWIGMMLLVVLVTKLRCLEFNVQSSAAIRLVVIITSVLFIYAVSQVNVFCCQRLTNATVPGAPAVTPTPAMHSPPPWPHVPPATVSTGSSSNGFLAPSSALLVPSQSHLSCDIPHYLPLSCVLSLLVLTGFMSLPAIGKLLLSLLIFTSYTVVTEVTHRSLFDHYDVYIKWIGLPGHVLAILCMALFVVFVYTQGRFMEYTMRLGHLWRSQARANLEEAERFRDCSELVLKNVLPEHVALYFLDNTYRNPIGLYSQEYNCLGVLCASVPTWQLGGDATIHDDIRRLNDLIVQFDDLLQQEKFAPLDKVRALFNGYVIVVGVNPQFLLEDNTSKMQYLTLLIQFAMSMKRVTDEMNASMGVNRMKLRVGIHAGAGFCGVVGAHRPGFDLWGEAFQYAAVLERSGSLQQVHASTTVVTFTQAQYDFVEHSQIPLPSPAPPGCNLTSYVLCEGQRASNHHANIVAGGNRLHNKRYSVPCNSAVIGQVPPALPAHSSGSHSVSRSAMRAVRQNSLSVAAPLPVVAGVGTPPQNHHRSHHHHHQQQQQPQQPQQQLPSHAEQAMPPQPGQDEHLHHHQQHHHQLQQQQHQQFQQQQHNQLPQHHQQIQQQQQHHQQFQQQQRHQQLQQQQRHQQLQQQQFQQQSRDQFPQHDVHHQQLQQQQFQQPQLFHHQQQPIQQQHQQPLQQSHQQHPHPHQHPHQQGHRQPSAPHTPASEVGPSLPPRPCNPVGSEMVHMSAPPEMAANSGAAPPHLPTASQSSLNSFLQLEDECSSVPRPMLLMAQGQASPPESAGAMGFGGVGDHYNPLYTDNEYDTDLDAAFATRSGGGGRHQSSLHSSPLPTGPNGVRPGSNSSGGAAHGVMTDSGPLIGFGPPPTVSIPTSSAAAGVGMFSPGATSGGGANSPAAAFVHQLDFPDYKRPSSPGGGSNSFSGPIGGASAPSRMHGMGVMDSSNGGVASGPGLDDSSLPLGSGTLDSEMTHDDGHGLMFTLSESGRGVRLKAAADRHGASVGRRRLGDTEDELEEVEESDLDLDSNAGGDGHSGLRADLCGADSELEAVRLQSDLASELSENLFVSDIEDAIGGERLYRFPAGNRMAQQQELNRDERPTTLPDVAPVGLPDFSLLGPSVSEELTHHYLRRPHPDDDDDEEEDDDRESADESMLHMRQQQHQQRELAALERRRDRFKGNSGRRAAAASPSVRSEYDNMCSESDAGYTGDVASSAYEEDSADDDDSDLDLCGHFRQALRHSDYDNMAAAAAAGMMDVNNMFNEQIAEEARRISHVFQQHQWNGAETGTSAGEEEEEEEEEEEGVTEVAAATAPHEDGGESPMSLPPELTKSETLVALLGADPHAHLHHDDEAPLSMTSSFSEVATTSEVGESEYDNYESDTANGELSSSSWFTGFPLHQFEPGPPSSGGTGGGGGNTRTTVV